VYVTGDQFFRDPDGFFHYCGRADDMLKVSGMWVSPLEVENALLAHPAVAEAAVVGRHDPDGLTQIIAFIVKRATSTGPGRAGVHPLPSCHSEPAAAGEESQASESSPLADELRTFVKQHLPGYKVPHAIEFVPDLPKTATGKIQRFKLRE
jgi:benzoate-CoA ligase